MSPFAEETKDGFTISTDPARLQRDVIFRYLHDESYWAAGIPEETVNKAIDFSLCFGMYQGNEQVGFARVVTDRATFAYLADVFILPPWRGKGLSKWMLDVIHAHPELQQLRRWLLATRDAHGLYAGKGWTPLDETALSRFMQLHHKDVYRKSAR